MTFTKICFPVLSWTYAYVPLSQHMCVTVPSWLLVLAAAVVVFGAAVTLLEPAPCAAFS